MLWNGRRRADITCVAYVDTNLVGSGKVNQAAILGQQGGVWATSPGFEVSE